MTLQEAIIQEVRELNDPEELRQLSEYLYTLKKKRFKLNKEAVLQLAGSLKRDDADEMRRIIDQEFNRIEGGW